MIRRVGVLFAVALGVWGRAAPAQTTMGFIISGDCRDPDLSQNARQLARELKAKLGDTLLLDDAVRMRLSPQPSVNADDLARQLDAAETRFYNGEYGKAEAGILQALDEIRRFPPGPERWKLTVKAELLQSQVIRRLGRQAEADELFRHVLRLQPGFQLDPDYFMPSIRQRFDRLRKELQATRKVRVEVKSIPAGADVFLDGVKVGTTPAALDVWPGDYEVLVAREGQRSLPHQLAARKENAILVDLQFEGAIQLDRDPCFATRPGDERSRLAGALKIATLLGVDSMVVLHLARSPTGPSSLGATVLDTQTAQKVRYGEIKLQGGPQQPAPGLGELAKFVVTGEFGKQLVAVNVAPQPPAPRPGVPGASKGAPAAQVVNLAPLVPASHAAAPLALPRGWRGQVVLGLGGGGAAVGLAGAVLLVLGNSAMAESNQYYQAGPPHEDAVDRIVALRGVARAEQTAAVVGLAAGGAALAASAALFFTAPERSAPLSVAASPGGAAVQLRW